ncbi:unnamed protein product, partial [Rotaria sp. Silwood1]
GGELFTYLNKRQHFSEQDAKIYITDLTLALDEVHKDKRTYSFCGTIEYTAPEIVKSGDAEHDLSLGVLTIELLTGASPFTIDGDRKHSIRNIKTSSFFQNYELIDRKGFLGKGSYSICRRCQNRRTREEFAVKIVSLRQEIDTKNEIDLLNLCQDHANIVRLHEVYFNELNTYIIMELLMRGEFFYRIRTQTSLSEKEASQLMRKLVSVVNFMHSTDLCHRDLKPENLLFSSSLLDAEIKIIDFGFGFAKKSTKHQPMTTPCGTLLYTALEVHRAATSLNHYQSSSLSISSVSSSSSSLSSTSTTVALVPSTLTNTSPITYDYDESCDLWSLGVILYTVLSGEVSFNSITTHRTAEDIVEDITPAKHFVKGLLTVDPSKRLTIKDLSRNTWLRGSSIQTSHDLLMTPSIHCQASQSLIICVVSTNNVPSSILSHTRRLCRNGVCRDRHAPCPPTNGISSLSSFDFSDERLSQLINQYPLTTTIPPKRYGMTLRSRATVAINGVQHELASPVLPPPLLFVPSLSFSSSSSSIIIDIHSSTNTNSEKCSLRSRIHHPLASVNKKMKRSGTITIDD